MLHSSRIISNTICDNGLTTQNKTSESVFHIHGSVYCDSVLIRSNKIQQYGGIYLLQDYSTCFRRRSRPSSGVQKKCSLWYMS